MANHRIEKINNQIQRELSLIIQKRMKDVRLNKTGISITSVHTTSDLKETIVYVSVLGSEAEKEETLKILNSAKGFLRSALAKVLKVYSIPALVFKPDNSIAYGMHIESILADLKKGQQSNDHSAEEDS